MYYTTPDLSESLPSSTSFFHFIAVRSSFSSSFFPNVSLTQKLRLVRPEGPKMKCEKIVFFKNLFLLFISSFHQLATVLLFFRWPSLRDTSVAQTTRTVTMLNGYPPPTRRLVSRKLRERDLDKSPATVSLDGENLVTMTVHT